MKKNSEAWYKDKILIETIKLSTGLICGSVQILCFMIAFSLINNPNVVRPAIVLSVIAAIINGFMLCGKSIYILVWIGFTALVLGILL